MNEQEKILRTAAERLLAVANGAEMELYPCGMGVCYPHKMTVEYVGGNKVRIRPPAAPPEPKPSQAVIDACKRLGVEAWKLDRFKAGDRILGNGYVEAGGKDCYGEWCLPAEWLATSDQPGNSTARYWHVRPIAQAKPPGLPSEYAPHPMGERKPELPPKPSQDWLDKHGVELTGECRAANKGEFACCTAEGFDIPQQNLCGYGKWDGPYWIVRKREPAPELPCPPRPTPEQVAAARMPDGRKVKPPTVCEVPNGRAYFNASDSAFVTMLTKPDERFGQRRWIAEPAEDVVTPWALDPVHAGKVVVRKTDGWWGIIQHGTPAHFSVSGCGLIAPDELLRDYTHNGQPCGEVAK